MLPMKMAIFWDVAPCSLAIALMMEAISTSETSVSQSASIYRLHGNIPEDSHIHTCRRENLKSHQVLPNSLLTS
jgi:hypothetical protein